MLHLRETKGGDYLYNFWQDEEHVRGIWRRTTLEEYRKDRIQWDVLLDLDRLAEKEQKNWVYKGVNCLYPDYNRCFISLSRGGKDAVVQREYDISTRTFVEGGFQLEEAKSGMAWIDHDTVLVSTDFGPDTLTASGYPAMIKLWPRGQNLDHAQLLMKIDRQEMGVWGHTQFRPERAYTFITRVINIWTQEVFLRDATGNFQLVNLPKDADFQGFWQEKALAILRSDWRGVRQGAVIALDLATDKVSVIYQPGKRGSASYVVPLRESILINTLEDVSNILFEASLENGVWRKTVLPFRENSAIDVASSDDFHAEYFVVVRNFVTPSTLYMYEKNMEQSLDLKNLLTPDYHALVGKLWLEKGGVYVVSNIRGGGEFGPKWHQAALKKNRYNPKTGTV